MGDFRGNLTATVLLWRYRPVTREAPKILSFQWLWLSLVLQKLIGRSAVAKHGPLVMSCMNCLRSKKKTQISARFAWQVISGSRKVAIASFLALDANNDLTPYLHFLLRHNLPMVVINVLVCITYFLLAGVRPLYSETLSRQCCRNLFLWFHSLMFFNVANVDPVLASRW